MKQQLAVDTADVTKWGKWRRPATLYEAAWRVNMARGCVLKWVRISRFRGATWEQVATALGITRQAAWSRFRQPCIGVASQYHQPLLQGALKVLQLWGLRVREADEWVEQLVHESRAAGRSWDEIATELGVRRQTVWERYGNSEKVR